MSHYEVLGINQQATISEIKRAYLKEAKKYHPDVNSSADATRRFQELGEAYNVLGNASRRAEYDNFLRRGYQTSSASGARTSSSGPHPPPPGGQPDVDPSELFRAVLEELGFEDIMQYWRNLQAEAGRAAEKAQSGDLQPARDFAWKNKSLFVGVVLPAAVLLRFPFLVGMALRGSMAIATLVLTNHQARQLLGRWAWFRWQIVMRRARQRASSRKG
jgi:DnaJ-class molecular chaperone